MIRASFPLCSICRERKSIQTLWPSSESSCSRDLAIGGLPFHLFDLLKPSDVALASVEACAQERSCQLGREFFPHDLGAEAQDIHVVVLYPLVRRVGVVADRAADAGNLVHRDRGADPGAADEQRALGLAGADRVPDLPGLVRAVDPRLGAVGAEVDRLVPKSGELLQHPLAQLDAAMVERDRDTHRTVTLPRWKGLSSGVSWDSSCAWTRSAPRRSRSPAIRPRRCPPPT